RDCGSRVSRTHAYSITSRSHVTLGESQQRNRDMCQTDICRKLSKMLDSSGMASGSVSYLDAEGLRHTVEVDAESLYEAAELAIRTFRQHDCKPGQVSRLEVEVRSSVTHTITPKRIYDWLNGGAKTPKEAVMKERLRALL